MHSQGSFRAARPDWALHFTSSYERILGSQTVTTKTPDIFDNPFKVPRISGRASLTQQVLEAMVRAIHQGSFASGRFPPEDQLARQLGVSRTTVRRALQSMEQIGLIERRPGRGTKLRVHAKPDLLALHGLVPFPTLLRELGHDVVSRVSWRKLDTVPPDLLLQLGREASGGSYELHVVLLASGVPAVTMVERFPTDVLGSTPSDQDLQAGSILFVSERCFAQKIDHAVATLAPGVTNVERDEQPVAALELPDRHAYLALQETFYSAEEVPLATSHVVVNPKYVSFSVFRRFL